MLALQRLQHEVAAYHASIQLVAALSWKFFLSPTLPSALALDWPVTDFHVRPRHELVMVLMASVGVSYFLNIGDLRMKSLWA